LGGPPRAGGCRQRRSQAPYNRWSAGKWVVCREATGADLTVSLAPITTGRAVLARWRRTDRIPATASYRPTLVRQRPTTSAPPSLQHHGPHGSHVPAAWGKARPLPTARAPTHRKPQGDRRRPRPAPVMARMRRRSCSQRRWPADATGRPGRRNAGSASAPRGTAGLLNLGEPLGRGWSPRSDWAP
jgi:hypothetical protein